MDIVCLGEILIDMFPAEVGRPLPEVSAFKPKPGGAPANVAVAATRLGRESAFIGKVGDDAFGYHLADILRQEGVNFDCFQRCAAAGFLNQAQRTEVKRARVLQQFAIQFIWAKAHVGTGIAVEDEFRRVLVRHGDEGHPRTRLLVKSHPTDVHSLLLQDVS